MTKALTKAQQIRAYVAKNPNAKPIDIAKEMGVNRQYVYTVMWTAKKKAAKKLGRPRKVVEVAPTLQALNDEYKNKISAQAPMQNVNHNVPVQIEMFEPATDPVNHPAHYKVGGIETIDFIEAKKLNYNIGNVVKYLTRADHKGNRKQDLEKAMWYLNREINSLK